MPPFKLVSFWTFVALAILMVLLAIPVVGVVASMFGALGLTGFLVHGFLISLFVEAIMRRVSRYWLVVPIAAYGAYYAAYLYQGIDIERTSAALRASNPVKIFDFDPSSHSLVATGAQQIVEGYAIPVAYQMLQGIYPGGYFSFRLIRRDQCNDIRRDSPSNFITSGVHFAGRFQQNVCILRVPEAPPLKQVRAERRGDEGHRKKKWGITQQVTNIVVDDVVLGSYRTASAWRLPALPVRMVIGCFTGFTSSALQCGAEFHQTHVVLDTVPNSVDRQSYDSPVSVMLGLRKYTASDLALFQGYESNDAVVPRPAVEPVNEDSEFELLAGIVAGERYVPSPRMGRALAQNPSRLVPLAEKMAQRFIELNTQDLRRDPRERDQARALATALALLPREAFQGVSEPIFDTFRKPQFGISYPALYLRTSDIGTSTLALFNRDFMVARPGLQVLPALALCRIGQADAATVAEMKRRLLANEGANRPYDNNDNYKSGLFVALLKLGEEAYLRSNVQALPEQLRPWAEAVLAGQGASATGPNNCMGWRWTFDDYLSPTMMPGLQFVRGAWVPRV